MSIGIDIGVGIRLSIRATNCLNTSMRIKIRISIIRFNLRNIYS